MNGGTAEYGLSSHNLYPCRILDMQVKVSSALCGKSGKWINGKCAEVKRVTLEIRQRIGFGQSNG